MIRDRYGAFARRNQHNFRLISGVGIKRRLAIAGAALTIWAAGLGSTADGAAFSCQDRVLVDYGRALEAMPHNHLPSRQGLPFGPGDLELRGARSIVVAGEPITYQLVLHRPVTGSGHVVRSAQLGWMIAMRLDPVDRLGQPTGVSGRRRWRVRKLQDPERRFELPADDPGLYRVSVRIQKHGGRTLANFWQFVRILPLRKKLSIRVRDGKTFRPGETVAARLENRGTVEVTAPVGTGLTAEHLVGGLWNAVEVHESPSVMFEDPEFLPRGRASGCSFFTIPSDSEPGKFRFSAVVQTGVRGPRKIVGGLIVLE